MIRFFRLLMLLYPSAFCWTTKNKWSAAIDVDRPQSPPTNEKSIIVLSETDKLENEGILWWCCWPMQLIQLRIRQQPADCMIGPAWKQLSQDCSKTNTNGGRFGAIWHMAIQMKAIFQGSINQRQQKQTDPSKSQTSIACCFPPPPWSSEADGTRQISWDLKHQYSQTNTLFQYMMRSIECHFSGINPPKSAKADAIRRNDSSSSHQEPPNCCQQAHIK